jgi:hypothetical protein
LQPHVFSFSSLQIPQHLLLLLIWYLSFSLIGNHHKQTETQKPKKQRLKTQKGNERSVPVLTTAEPQNLNAGVRRKSNGGRSAVPQQRRTGEPKKPDMVLEISTASLLYSSLRCCFGADRSDRFGASTKMNIERERMNMEEKTKNLILLGHLQQTSYFNQKN